MRRGKFLLFFIFSLIIFCFWFSLVYASKQEKAFELFEKAKLYYEKGEYKRAQKYLRDAINIVPYDGELLIEIEKTVYENRCRYLPLGRTVKKVCKRVPIKKKFYEKHSYYPNKLLLEIIAQTAPPYLEIEEIKFTDENKNKVFEAGEKAYLFVRIFNRGKGKSSDTKLEVSSTVFGERVIDLGEIFPNNSVEKSLIFTVPVKVKTKKETLTLKVLAGEYSPEPIKIAFYTKAPLPPQFKIWYRVDDDNVGESIGNSNGIIEPRETIELYVNVENVGKGLAKGVELLLKSSDVSIFKGVAKIGNIPPGKQAKGKLVFFVPANSQKEKINLSLELHEAFGIWHPKYFLTFDIKKLRSKVIEIGNKTSLTSNSLINEGIFQVPCVKQYPNRYFLSIGEINYVNQPSLECVKNDLQLIRHLATCYMGVSEENFESHFDVSYASFKHIVRNFIKKIKEDDATFIFYYSGHGLMHWNGEVYLLPIDADISTEENMKDSSIPLSFLEDTLGKAKGRKIFILDTCLVKVFWKPGYLVQKFLARGDITLLLATQPNKLSYVTNEGSSVFTTALWKVVQAGFKNLDLNGSGYIELEEIKIPLIQRMKELNLSQKLEIIGPEDVKFFPVK